MAGEEAEEASRLVKLKTLLPLCALLASASASQAQDNLSDGLALTCSGEIWIRQGSDHTERLLDHQYIEIELFLDRGSGVLRVDSPYKIAGVAGGDQILVRETPGKYYFATAEMIETQAQGHFDSTLDRSSGFLVLMEGGFFSERARSAFNGTCQRIVQRF